MFNKLSALLLGMLSKLSAYGVTLFIVGVVYQQLFSLSAADDMVSGILSRHINALGGETAQESLSNVRYQLLIEEPTFTVRGDYRAALDGRMRIDIYDGEQRVFSEGIDRQGGWQQLGEGTGILALSPGGLEALQRGIDQNLHGLYELPSRGHRQHYLGRELHNGTEYHRLKVEMRDGFERHYYINPESWLVDYSRETSALHPDIDATEKPVESHYADYLTLCGVTRSRTVQTIELASRERIQQSIITGARCNLPEQALDLDRPAD